MRKKPSDNNDGIPIKQQQDPRLQEVKEELMQELIEALELGHMGAAQLWRHLFETDRLQQGLDGPQGLLAPWASLLRDRQARQELQQQLPEAVQMIGLENSDSFSL